MKTRSVRTAAKRVVAIRKHRPLRGLFKGQIEIKGDIVHVDFSGDWETNK
jgi:hypothetical protein